MFKSYYKVWYFIWCRYIRTELRSWNPNSAMTHGEGHSENVYLGIWFPGLRTEYSDQLSVFFHKSTWAIDPFKEKKNQKQTNKPGSILIKYLKSIYALTHYTLRQLKMPLCRQRYWDTIIPILLITQLLQERHTLRHWDLKNQIKLSWLSFLSLCTRFFHTERILNLIANT